MWSSTTMSPEIVLLRCASLRTSPHLRHAGKPLREAACSWLYGIVAQQLYVDTVEKLDEGQLY